RTVIINLALHIPFFPAGIGVAEAHTEVIMGSETGEKFRFMDRIANPPRDTGCIVKDQSRRYAGDKFKDILQALADTLRSFSAEYLAVSIIAVRERHGQIFLPAELPGLIKVSFPKINLCRSGIPDQFQVC